jgi:hypothetical protein
MVNIQVAELIGGEVVFQITKICVAVAAGVLAAASFGAAQAAVVVQTYNFTLGGFFDTNVAPVAPPPITAISGRFTVTFDTHTYVEDGLGIVVNSLNGITVDPPFAYTFWPAGVGYPAFLSIGGLQSGAAYIDGSGGGTDDFTLSLRFTDPWHPELAICDDGYNCDGAAGTTLASGYTREGLSDSYFLATTGSVSVPEPAAWALMILGFGVTGAALRSRRKLRTV